MVSRPPGDTRTNTRVHVCARAARRGRGAVVENAGVEAKGLGGGPAPPSRRGNTGEAWPRRSQACRLRDGPPAESPAARRRCRRSAVTAAGHQRQQYRAAESMTELPPYEERQRRQKSPVTTRAKDTNTQLRKKKNERNTNGRRTGPGLLRREQVTLQLSQQHFDSTTHVFTMSGRKEEGKKAQEDTWENVFCRSIYRKGGRGGGGEEGRREEGRREEPRDTQRICKLLTLIGLCIVWTQALTIHLESHAAHTVRSSYFSGRSAKMAHNP